MAIVMGNIVETASSLWYVLNFTNLWYLNGKNIAKHRSMLISVMIIIPRLVKAMAMKVHKLFITQTSIWLICSAYSITNRGWVKPATNKSIRHRAPRRQFDGLCSAGLVMKVYKQIAFVNVDNMPMMPFSMASSMVFTSMESEESKQLWKPLHLMQVPLRGPMLLLVPIIQTRKWGFLMRGVDSN